MNDHRIKIVNESLLHLQRAKVNIRKGRKKAVRKDLEYAIRRLEALVFAASRDVLYEVIGSYICPKCYFVNNHNIHKYEEIKCGKCQLSLGETSHGKTSP